MDPTIVAAVIAAGVSVVTLVITMLVQYRGYRATSRDSEKALKEQREHLDLTLGEQSKHLERTIDAQNAQLDRQLAEQRTRTLNERFGAAAEQLGSDKPAVRLAGVYAMAGLADDWEENRQTCVDVLCAYLRMPYEPAPGPGAAEPQQLAFRSSREVRHTVIRVIAAHLRKDASISWEGIDFDFTGAVFDGGDFAGARFSDGLVKFSSAKFSGGLVSFNSALFSGAWVFFDSADFSGGTISFDFANFTGGTLIFDSTEFSAGQVDFTSARFSGGSAWFMETRFSCAKVNFNSAEFSGCAVDFSNARFSGGEVNFSQVSDWSVPPEFSWRDTLPAGVRLPSSGGKAK